MIIPYGPWWPDMAGVDVRDAAGRIIMQMARNVLVTPAGFAPFNSLQSYETNAISGCRGLFAARTASGGWKAFAGTSTKLYGLEGTTWVDYTRSSGGDYAVPADEYWDFDQFGSKVIAVNSADDAQTIDVDSGASNFSALGGSPPKAKYVSVVGDFVVLGALASNPRKIRNSAINNAEGWTVGTNLCDEQEFPDGGRVTGIAGGEFGWIGQETAIRQMIFQPGQDVAFRFERILQDRGVAAAYSMVAVGGQVFFRANDGFYGYGPNGLDPIGADKFNIWFNDNSDASRFFSIISFFDVYRPIVYWAFYNSDTSTLFDRVLAYNWKQREATYLDVEAQYWTQFATPGTTLEDLDAYGDLDTLMFSLDSRVWEGGRPVVAAINSDGELAFPEGTLPANATLLTCPMHLGQGRRARVIGVYPRGVFNGATNGIRVGKQEHSGASQSFTSSAAPSSRTGTARMISSGRIHQFEQVVTQSSGTTWQHAQGLDVSASLEGVN